MADKENIGIDFDTATIPILKEFYVIENLFRGIKRNLFRGLKVQLL